MLGRNSRSNVASDKADGRKNFGSKWPFFWQIILNPSKYFFVSPLWSCRCHGGIFFFFKAKYFKMRFHKGPKLLNAVFELELMLVLVN